MGQLFNKLSSVSLPRVMVALGTRPDAIKLAPVVQALRDLGSCEVDVVSSGQHDLMLATVLEELGVDPTYQLPRFAGHGDLNRLLSGMISGFSEVFEKSGADLVIVQGDTATALAAALTAFNLEIKIAHVESGLRSGDLHSPFPEEANRRLIGQLADLNFAPSEQAARNLANEGIPAERIFVSGNTILDSLNYAVASTSKNPKRGVLKFGSKQGKLVLVTAHRRENWHSIEDIAKGIYELSLDFPTVDFVFVMHANPYLQEKIRSILGDLPNVHLSDPLPYLDFVVLLQSAYLVVTDSGGLQEEAPALGIPLVLLRTNTERPEVAANGSAMVIGSSESSIRQVISELLSDSEKHTAMATPSYPYGQGGASELIANEVMKILQ